MKAEELKLAEIIESIEEDCDPLEDNLWKNKKFRQVRHRTASHRTAAPSVWCQCREKMETNLGEKERSTPSQYQMCYERYMSPARKVQRLLLKNGGWP